MQVKHTNTNDSSMSYIIELDSKNRDRQAYPNPHIYDLQPSKVDTWLKGLCGNKNAVTMEVGVTSVVLPYQHYLLDQPKLYLDVHMHNLDSVGLIDFIDNDHRRAKFILTIDEVQKDSAGAKTWIHYKTDGMKQFLSFERGKPFHVEIFDVNGNTLEGADAEYPSPYVPKWQTFVTLKLTRIRAVNTAKFKNPTGQATTLIRPPTSGMVQLPRRQSGAKIIVRPSPSSQKK